MSPTTRETLAPYRMRVKTSLPSSSVPNRCSGLGAFSLAVRSCWASLYGAIHGANIAMRITARITIAEITASGFCLNKRRRKSLKPPDSISSSVRPSVWLSPILAASALSPACPSADRSYCCFFMCVHPCFSLHLRNCSKHPGHS